MGYPLSSYKDYFVSYEAAYNIFAKIPQMKEKIKSDKKLSVFVNSLKEDDNPVIVLYKTKGY